MPISINGTTASVTGLTNGTSYRFRVAARNAVGLGPYTAATAPGSPSGPPGPPPPPATGTSWEQIVLTPSPPEALLSVRDVVVAGPRLYDKSRYLGPVEGPGWSASRLRRLAPLYSTNGTAWNETQGASLGPFSFGGGAFTEAWIPQTVLYGLARVGIGQDYDTYVGVAARTVGGVYMGWAPDGSSWEVVPPVSAHATVAGKLDTACYDGWRFTASSPNPVGMLHSSDGITWNLETGVYLAAVGGGYAFYRRRNPSTGSFGSTYFAGVPELSSAVPSSLWATNLPLTAKPFFADAPAGAVRYIATTSSGTYYTSITGADITGSPQWTERTLPQGFAPAPAAQFSSPVAYGNGHWLMLARTFGSSQWRTLLRSADAINWTPLTTMPATAAWTNITFFDGYFYASAVGDGVVYRSQ